MEKQEKPHRKNTFYHQQDSKHLKLNLKNKKIKKEKKKETKIRIHEQHQDSYEKMTVEKFILEKTNKYTVTQEYKIKKQIDLISHLKVLAKDVLSTQSDQIYEIDKKTKCENTALQYLRLLKDAEKFTNLNELVVRSETFGIIGHIMYSLLETGELQFRILHVGEARLLAERLQVKRQIGRLIKNHIDENLLAYTGQLPFIESEILNLMKILNNMETEIRRQMTNILQTTNTDIVEYLNFDQSREIQIKASYLSLLIRKNLYKSFDQSPTHILDYFHNIQFIQKKEKNSFRTRGEHRKTCNTRLELDQFIDRRKSKKGKNPQYFLPSACTACFSNYYQASNPIQNCPECFSRIHKCCQKIDGRCHRCRYNRTASQQKSLVEYCDICKRKPEKNMMILTITNFSPHKFAHVFCLLVQKEWKVEMQHLEYSSQQVEVGEEEITCKYCLKAAQKHVKCSYCCDTMHGMCGYLHGCSFKMHNQESQDYSIEVNCCNDQSYRRRLSNQRKFKLNYQKVTILKDKQLFHELFNS